MSEALSATCHCGAVELKVTLSDGFETKRRCDCSFCRLRQAAAVTAPSDGVQVMRGADALTTYQFGTNTAEHHFCSRCGIYMYHRRRSNPNELGVNLYAFEGQMPSEHEPVGWADGINHPSDRKA